eukprot:IDg22661t1
MTKRQEGERASGGTQNPSHPNSSGAMDRKGVDTKPQRERNERKKKLNKKQAFTKYKMRTIQRHADIKEATYLNLDWEHIDLSKSDGLQKQAGVACIRSRTSPTRRNL